MALKDGFDVVLTEIGGTVGDIEGMPFLEAIRQMGLEEGQGNTLFVHLSLVPYIESAGEVKTKPTQHSVKELREIGIQPHILLCRTPKQLTRELKEKIGLFCNVPPEAVIQAIDVPSIYEVPLLFHQEKLDELVIKHLNLPAKEVDLSDWEKMVEKIKNPKHNVKIGIVGKYTHLKDAYKSIIEAFTHAGVENDCKVEICWVNSEEIQKFGPEKYLSDLDGILIPGGFGERGIEGKIDAVKYARERKIPYLGICLGMQVATIEFARNVYNLEKANSSEFDLKSPHPVIHLMPEQEKVTSLGGTMRLGAYPCILEKGSFAHLAYGEEKISERHRHRYEFNNEYREILTKAGFKLTGLSPDKRLVEIIEISDHPWFVGVQFHPELKSRPTKAHPLFRDFVKAALKYNHTLQLSLPEKQESCRENGHG
jgi:CTP synthase